MRALRHAAAGLALALLGACARDDASEPRESPSPTQGARQAWAVAHVTDGRSVRWLSATELCVPPVDAPDPLTCATRTPRRHAAAVHRRIRDAIPDSADARDMVVCLRVSREIVAGDTTLVLVRSVGEVLVNRRARHRGWRVLFTPDAAGDSVRVFEDRLMLDDDGPPVEERAGC